MTSLHLIDGRWIEGNPPLLGPMANAFWMASVAFDGARAFAGVAPDLGRHAARLLSSAKVLGLEPTVSSEEIVARAWDGIKVSPRAANFISGRCFTPRTASSSPSPRAPSSC